MQGLSYDDPSKTFHGVRFILQGFDSVKEEEVRSKLLEGGGIDAVNYGPNCNHVVVDKLVYDDPICVAARRDGKVLVTGLWVDHSFDVGMPVDPSSVMYWPMKDLNGIPGAKSLILCLTGYQRQDRDDIMTMVALMGASFSKPLVANKITHLICYKFEGEKYELAKKMKKIKLINHRWLEDCLKAWELLPETDYAKSGYELEMEAEAKDSEEETEDVASIDLRRRSVVSPQNTRVENKILHQSPLKQDVSRNTVYLSASENFANTGETSKIKSTPSKEIDNAKKSFSRGTDDKHLDKSTSSCARSPVKSKTPSKAPSNMLDGVTNSEKVEHVTTSASRNAKKSSDANLSKLSSKSRKSSLPLSSERIGNNGSPVALNASKPGFIDDFDILLERHQGGTDSQGAKTPLKESSLHLDEGKTRSFPSKRKATASRGSSKSPLLSYSPKNIVGTALTPKTTELPVSGSSVDDSHRLIGDVSPAYGTSNSREKVSGGLLSQRLLDRIVSDGVKTPSKANLLHHLDEGKTGNLSSKRKTTVSRGNSRSPISSHIPKTSMGSGVATKMTELPISGSSIDGSRRVAGNISPMNITSRLREEASLSSKEALNITTSEAKQDCNDQVLQHSPQGFVKQTLSNLDADNPFSRSNTSTGGVEIHQSDPQSIGHSIPRTSSGVDEMVDQGDLNSSKVENRGNQSKPKKTKMFARKTLGARPTIPKGSTAKRKGPINLQSAALQNECTNQSKGAVAMEVTDNAAIPEKAAVVSPTTNEDGPVDDETKAPDDEERNEFDLGSDLDESAKVGASKLGKNVSRAKKQVKCKTIQTKEKSAKSVGVKNNGEAEKSSRGKKNELPESKSTGDAGEGEITKGKKRPLTKSKTNKSRDSREEVKNNGSKSKQDEEKCVSSNKKTDELAGTSNKRPSKKLKSSADEDKENEHATARQKSARNDTGKVTSPQKNGLKVNDTNSGNLKVKTEPAMFILSGHRLQRKEFQQVIKRLKGRVCRDSHNWSYQATHFVVPDPVRRTEKFFAAAASGCWILKTDYLTASNEAGRFLSEEPYEWHKKCLTEDGAINLQAPRKWRLLRERTGRGAFYGMRIIIYGECIAPPLDTLKRAVKAGDGTILATSPPYTRFLNSGVDFAIVSPVMPHQDIWIQEFLRHEVPCVVADYLVEYVCKPGYSLQRHIQYNTHEWAQKSLDNQMNRLEEVIVGPTTPEDDRDDDVACRVCESRDRGDEMLICGDESGRHGCGVGIHIDCLDPPLDSVLEEDWFCDECSWKNESKAVARGSKKRGSKSRK
ncbi:hypothetical protein ACS0TY_005210 [Phlomoides rotata]